MRMRRLEGDALTRWVAELISKGQEDRFYKSAMWLHCREEVLRDQHYECQMCRQKGLYEKATTVHHKEELKARPDLALEKSNLLALCAACHNAAHERFAEGKAEAWDDERWS